MKIQLINLLFIEVQQNHRMKNSLGNFWCLAAHNLHHGLILRSFIFIYTISTGAQYYAIHLTKHAQLMLL